MLSHSFYTWYFFTCDEWENRIVLPASSGHAYILSNVALTGLKPENGSSMRMKSGRDSNAAMNCIF